MKPAAAFLALLLGADWVATHVAAAQKAPGSTRPAAKAPRLVLARP